MIRLIAILAMVAFGACTAPPAPSASSMLAPALLQNGAPVLQVASQQTGQSTVLFQQTLRDGAATWVAAGGAMLTTRDGFLVATRGFGGDLLGADISQTRDMVLRGRTGQVERFNSYLDGENRPDLQAYVCDIVVQTEGEVVFPDGPVQTTIFREDCVNPDRSFFNLYWRDGRGQIVQTRQWAGALAGVITTRIVP